MEKTKVKNIMYWLSVAGISAAYLSLIYIQRGVESLWNRPHETAFILGLVSLLSLVTVATFRQSFLKLTVAIFIVLQLFLITNLRSVHNDVYRYMFDGIITKTSSVAFPFTLTPLRYTPDELMNSNIERKDHAFVQMLLQEKVPQRDFWHKLDFKHLHTIYPGTAQVFFFLGALFEFHEIIAYRLLLLFFGILTLFGLYKASEEAHRWLPMVMLHPIFFFDGIIAVHLEMLLAVTLIWAVYLWHQKKYLKSGVLMSLSVFTKLYPVIIIPVFARRSRKVITAGIVGLVIGAFINLPFLYRLEHIQNFFASLQRFSSDWFAGPGLFMLFAWIESDSARLLSFIISTCCIAALYYLFYKKQITLYTAIAGSIASYIFWSPTIFSWYLLPLLVLMPLAQQKMRSLLLAPILVYPLQYMFINANNTINTTFIYDMHAGHVWWFWLLAWGPVVALIVYEVYLQIRKKYA